MGTVTIGSDTFTVYGDSAGLATYAAGSLTWSDTYDAAVVASANKPKRAHVEATRLLDRQRWQGTLTADGQALAWPRDGVTGAPASGVAVDDGTTPDEIVAACYELALAMMANVGVVATTTTANNVQSVTAGPTAVTFFSPKTGGRFPDRVMELIGWALGSAATSTTIGPLGMYASGTDGCSQFDTADGYGVNGG